LSYPINNQLKIIFLSGNATYIMCKKLIKVIFLIVCLLVNGHIVFAQSDTLSVKKAGAAKLIENAITTLATSLPSITIAASTYGSICSGTIITFTATIINPVGYPSYQWQVNGKNTGDINGPLKIGTLNDGDVVTCIMTNLITSIPTISSLPYTANVYPTPTITFDKNIKITKGSSINLNPVITGDIVNYSWTLASFDGTIASLSSTSIPNPVATPLLTTSYRLQVISRNACIQVGTVTVTVIVPIIIPTAFTPNGDGINDLWNISGLPDYKTSTINIYNRYGNEVFKSVGYANSWNGTYNGKAIPAGTYYYVINPKNGDKVLSGWVELVR
jgi:gliding motility-associated-like protein